MKGLGQHLASVCNKRNVTRKVEPLPSRGFENAYFLIQTSSNGVVRIQDLLTDCLCTARSLRFKAFGSLGNSSLQILFCAPVNSSDW